MNNLKSAQAYEFNQPRLEHIAVWAEDIDATAGFLEKALGWKRHPIIFGVAENNPVFGGMNLAFVDANGFWIELVQPTTEGPGMEFLRQKGNGAIVELDFEVDDFDTHVEAYKKRGIDLIGMDGLPLREGGLLSEWVLVDGKRIPADEHLSYLPFDLARGTSIELFTEEENGAVRLRDKQWNDADKTPATAPKFHHVTVLASDFGESLDVYAKILNLPVHPETAGLQRDWMGFSQQKSAFIDANKNGVRIELLSPVGPKKGIVDQFGDGAIVEIGVETRDIETLAASLRAMGVLLTAGDDTPLPEGKSSVSDGRTGDRYAYLSMKEAHGLRIRIFERGRHSAFPA